MVTFKYCVISKHEMYDINSVMPFYLLDMYNT